MAFPCSLSEWANLSLLTASQDIKGDMISCYDLASNVMQHHYRQTLLVKALGQVHPDSWEGTLKSRL